MGQKDAAFVAEADEVVCKLNHRGELDFKNIDKEKCRRILKVHLESND